MKRRVLLVDDDHDVLAAWTMFLGDAFELRVAHDGREALDALASEPCDVIVLDLMMPVMDGFEFLAAIRQDSGMADIPVIIVTAKDLTEQDHQRLNGSAEAIIQKSSIDHATLLDRVYAIIGKNHH